MVTTQFGIVEIDPMRVPVAASLKNDKSESFAASLDAASTTRREASTDHVDPDDALDTPQQHKAERKPSSRDSEHAVDQEQSAQDDADEQSAPVRAVESNDPARPEATRLKEPANKSSSSSVANQTIAGTAAAQATDTAESANLPTKAMVGDLQVGDAKAAAPNRPTLTDSLAKISSTITKRSAVPAPPTTTGYRTMNAQSVQMVEQARDSIFKQIMFKLGKETGEMRVRLDPPELGELDLRMQMDRAGNLRLSIGAERTDLREMLTHNLAELQRSLQQNGLQVTHAEVRSGSDHSHDTGESSANESTTSDDLSDGEQDPSNQGYYTAQGLDFWV